MLTNIVLAFLPVLLFLAGLVVMDSFKLAPPSAIARALAWGVAAALLCGLLYGRLAPVLPLSPASYSRFAAPIIEETAKAAFVVYLLRRRRIGFPVDAAQMGFAIGTGFAVVENYQYLIVLADASPALWVVRGLGTAMLHGAATAVFAMLAQAANSRREGRRAAFLLAGLLPIAIHAGFNSLPASPLAKTIVLLIALPLVVQWAFHRSERATREWFGEGLDIDLILHDTFASQALEYTRFGEYLKELRAHFPGHVVADMLCLLRVELELSIQAKGMMIARQAGAAMAPHPDARSAVDEIQHLRSAIGRTGLLALAPVNVSSYQDDWHRYLLTGTGGDSGWRRLRHRVARVAGLGRTA